MKSSRINSKIYREVTLYAHPLFLYFCKSTPFLVHLLLSLDPPDLSHSHSRSAALNLHDELQSEHVAYPEPVDGVHFGAYLPATGNVCQGRYRSPHAVSNAVANAGSNADAHNGSYIGSYIGSYSGSYSMRIMYIVSVLPIQQSV